MKNSNVVKCLLASIPFLGMAMYLTVCSIQFDMNITSYLKRAADANTVEMAEGELSKVLTILKEKNLNDGWSNIFWSTGANDVKFWYSNLETSYHELKSLPQNASHLEKSNMLIKLRETIIDHGEHGDKVTTPPNISIFPNQRFIALCEAFSMLILIGTILFVSYSEFKD